MLEAYYLKLLLMNLHNSDIICITETWLDETDELCIQNVDVIRLVSNKRGGGIIIYINDCFSHSIALSRSDDL